MKPERTYHLGRNTVVTTNVDCFELLKGEALVNASLAAGLITAEQHKAALERLARKTQP